jgi:hypothetical protein
MSPNSKSRRAFRLGFAVLSVAALAPIAVTLFRWIRRPLLPRETPIAKQLGTVLTTQMVQIASNKTRKFDANSAERALGPEAALALGNVLRKAEQINEDGPDGFLREAGTLNAALSVRHEPYWLDADVIHVGGRAIPLLMSFYEERRTVYGVSAADASSTDPTKMGATLSAGASPTTDAFKVTAMQLWRIDTVNVGYGYLGYTRPRTPFALVILNQIERELALYLLPALAPNRPFPVSGSVSAPAWLSSIELELGKVVRSEFDESADTRIAWVAQRLATRRALVLKWRELFPALGLSLRMPESYLPDVRIEGDLSRRIPRTDLDQWEDIERDLKSDEARKAFVRARETLAASVERHEVQHVIDYRSGLVPVPDELAELVGLRNPLDAPPGSTAGRARDELSAYLAQIAESERPRTDFVLAVRRVLEETVDAYTYAGWALLLGVGKELGVDVDVLRTRGRLPPRDAFAGKVVELGNFPGLALKQAAKRMRDKAFSPLQTVRLREQEKRQAWGP